jgi:integrase
MGSVIKRQLKGGPAWYIIFRMNGKQKWERVPPEYTGKRGALRFLGERESQRDMIVAGQITFEQSASTWLEATKTRVKPTSWEHYDVALRNHLLPEFGSRQIQGLRPADIQQFVTKKCTRLSVSYVRDAVVFVLRNILDLAVQHEQLSRSPVPRRLIYPRQEKKRMGRALTPDEAQQLLQHADPMFWPIFVTGLWSGMRIGEVLAMRWEHLDLERQRYEVWETLTQDLRFQSAKTSGSVAPVSLSPYLCTVLEDQRRQVAEWALEAKKWEENGLVFPDKKGKPLYQNRASHQLRKAAAGAKIGRVALHDLRHTCASLLIHEGADIKTVSEQLRHSSITITLDTYGHLYPERREEIVSKLDTLMGVG